MIPSADTITSKNTKSRQDKKTDDHIYPLTNDVLKDKTIKEIQVNQGEVPDIIALMQYHRKKHVMLTAAFDALAGRFPLCSIFAI